VFRGNRGEILYVGKATNLRARVRSYFSTDTRRKIGAMLRETVRIDHRVCANPLEAAVVEVRLIQRHTPRYNRRGTRTASYVYVALSRDRFPRLTVVRQPRTDIGVHVGPLPSAHVARLIVEAIESVVPLRRCTARMPSSPHAAPCTAAQLGVATCPCSGGIDEAGYHELVQRVQRGLTTEPELLLQPLRDHMVALASADRFEEAADVRNRADALAGALRRQRRLDGLRRAGRMRLEVRGEGGVELDGGRLVRAWAPGVAPPDELPLSDAETITHGEPLSGALADELHCVAGWLDGRAARVHLLHCADGLAEALPAVPSFAPREPARLRKDSRG
jgi:DNA polymerase-3 subunit epsilon